MLVSVTLSLCLSTEQSKMRMMCWKWTTKNRPTPSPERPMSRTTSEQHEFPSDLLSPLNLHAPLSFALTKPHVWTLTFALLPQTRRPWLTLLLQIRGFNYASLDNSTYSLNFCDPPPPFFSYMPQIKLSALNYLVALLFCVLLKSLYEDRERHSAIIQCWLNLMFCLAQRNVP